VAHSDQRNHFFFLQPIRPLPPGSQRRIEGHMAEEIEWVSVRLAGCLSQVIKNDVSFGQSLNNVARCAGSVYCAQSFDSDRHRMQIVFCRVVGEGHHAQLLPILIEFADGMTTISV
jgi:hypothetical protein